MFGDAFKFGGVLKLGTLQVWGWLKFGGAFKFGDVLKLVMPQAGGLLPAGHGGMDQRHLQH